MKKTSIRRFIFMATLTVAFLYCCIGSKGEVVENLDIPTGIGLDLIGNDYYRTTLAVYEFGPSENVISRVLNGDGPNIAETRNDRQRKANKRFLLGLERVYIFSDGFALHGIHSAIDILLNNPTVSDRSPAIVFKGKTADLLNYKIEGYANSAEYIEGMIKNSAYFNFFPNQFTIMDLIVRVDAEGRNSVLPFIELKEEGPEITGLAIFKEDKMIANTNIEEARTLSLLKFSGGKGILSIKKDSKHYIDMYVQSKRKVKCDKIDGKYKFVIELALNGSIVTNELYDKLNSDPKVLKKFTQDMETIVKKSCTEYINKIKNEYKIDCLDLGRVAAAKYGRQTGVDWDQVICDSSIDVNVKITVKDEGRGTY